MKRTMLRHLGFAVYRVVEGACLVAFCLATPVWLPILMTLGFLTRCPACGGRWMRDIGGIMETYPHGTGTGRAYACRRCRRQWWWSNDEQRYSPYAGQDKAGTIRSTDA